MITIGDQLFEQRQRIKELEAQNKMLKDVIRDAQMHIEAGEIDWARFQDGPDHDPDYKPKFPEIVERCRQALSAPATRTEGEEVKYDTRTN